jgi:glutaconate CoA-transferase subunit A
MMRHMEAYVAKVNAEPVEGMRGYLERHVYGPKTWTDFLSLIGLNSLLEAANKGRSIYND